MTNEHCPALSDLFAEPFEPQVRAHVATCRRCQALLKRREATTEATPRAGSLSSATRIQPLADFDIGGLISARVPGSDELLVAAVVEAADDEFVVAVVSDDTSLAAEWDLFIEDGALGYPAIIEAWNTGSVLIEQLYDVLGELPTTALRRLNQLYEASLEGGRPPEDLPTGPPVIAENDPRLRFQGDELERGRPAWLPASTLAEASTLVELLDRRLDELRLEWDEVNAALSDEVPDRPDWVTRMRERRLDIFEVVGVSAMQRLLAAFDLPASRRLASLVWGEVAETRQASPKAGSAFARRRRGHATARLPADPEAARQAADQYVSRLLDAWAK